MDRYFLSRRDVLRGALAATFGAGALPAFATPVGDSGKPASGKIGDFKISLAEWSLHKALRKKEMTNLDFPAVAREKYGIEAVEFVNQFFKDKAHDSTYLQGAEEAGRRQRRDLRPDHDRRRGRPRAPPTRPSATRRSRTTRRGSTPPPSWAATRSGSTPGSNYSPTDVEAIADGCSRLAEYGASKKINIICENHGGPSSDPDALIAVMKGVNNPRFGTLPDFGNFPKNGRQVYTIDVYDAIARMMPYAKGVSAKSYDFDATAGSRTSTSPGS